MKNVKCGWCCKRHSSTLVSEAECDLITKNRICRSARPSDRRTTCQRIIYHRGDHRAKITSNGRTKVYGWK